jgi:hypothetical protein
MLDGKSSNEAIEQMRNTGLMWIGSAILIAGVVCGCGTESTPVGPSPAGPSPEQEAIEGAFAFLQDQQVTVTTQERGATDYEGNWPQFFFLKELPSIRIRDVSPFILSFIHHALTHLVEDHAEALGLDSEQLAVARSMRQKAITVLRQFESAPWDPARGTFAFWPYDVTGPEYTVPVQNALMYLAKGPILNGFRTPINFDVFPDALAIPSDADVTATAFAALLDDERLDGGDGIHSAPEVLLSDWRDTGDIPLRFRPDWLPVESGVFLTWLIYGSSWTPNDVDLVVNANVLFALARYGRLETPGVSEAIDLINQVTEQGLHRTLLEEIALYYPDNYSYHYMVSRAYHEGPVPALQPAVEILADDLERSALEDSDGAAYWNKGAPELNTAFAVLTLMNAGRSTPLIEKGIEYLIPRQFVPPGNRAEGVFFFGRSDGGLEIRFVSQSFTTAMALEALCRFSLLNHPET